MQATHRALVGLIAGWGVLTTGAAARAAEHELGVGIHHWEALDDLDVDNVEIDESGTSALLVYRVNPAGLFAFELDVEYFGDGFAGATEEALAPQFFVLLGNDFYAGIGVGVTLADDLPSGDDVSDPFYAARVGFAFPLLPRLRLDLNGNYQTGTFEDLDQADSDTITVGAHLRLRIK
ncbi:MAG: hypothetical protein ACRD0X_05035 [Thermoanaerobaculia bacterium]